MLKNKSCKNDPFSKESDAKKEPMLIIKAKKFNSLKIKEPNISWSFYSEELALLG